MNLNEFKNVIKKNPELAISMLIAGFLFVGVEMCFPEKTKWLISAINNEWIIGNVVPWVAEITLAGIFITVFLGIFLLMADAQNLENMKKILADVIWFFIKYLIFLPIAVLFYLTTVVVSKTQLALPEALLVVGLGISFLIIRWMMIDLMKIIANWLMERYMKPRPIMPKPIACVSAAKTAGPRSREHKEEKGG